MTILWYDNIIDINRNPYNIIIIIRGVSVYACVCVVEGWVVTKNLFLLKHKK